MAFQGEPHSDNGRPRSNMVAIHGCVDQGDLLGVKDSQIVNHVGAHSGFNRCSMNFPEALGARKSRLKLCIEERRCGDRDRRAVLDPLRTGPLAKLFAWYRSS
jgi:hypothetical protein